MIDYDNDGLLDMFVVSGEGGRSRLYHNEGNDRFRDVSDAMGLTRKVGARARARAITTTTGSRISSSPTGARTSSTATRAASVFATSPTRLACKQDRVRYNTGCAFLDYDRDGRLDLFVANYLKFSFEETPKPGANPYCWYLGLAVNCGPRGLPFDRNILYHANRDGTFTDVSEKSGIGRTATRATA